MVLYLLYLNAVGEFWAGMKLLYGVMIERALQRQNVLHPAQHKTKRRPQNRRQPLLNMDLLSFLFDFHKYIASIVHFPF